MKPDRPGRAREAFVTDIRGQNRVIRMGAFTKKNKAKAKSLNLQLTGQRLEI